MKPSLIIVKEHQTEANNNLVLVGQFHLRNHIFKSRLLRIHADNQDKRSLCIFWALFFITLIAMAIASIGCISLIIIQYLNS